jgi:UDP:flavonoid glycosyltransferase YjiC (YdhE family)
MVAIPSGFDQPGIAARIARHRVGKFVGLKDLGVEHLKNLIRKVLHDPSYRDPARRIQSVIARTGGLDLAADVSEWGIQNQSDRYFSRRKRRTSPRARDFQGAFRYELI